MLLLWCLYFFRLATIRLDAAGCSSLAFTHLLNTEERPAAAAAGERQQHSSNSLVHCLLRLVPTLINTANIASLRLVFGVLATLALSPEGRGILWKVTISIGIS